MNKYIIALSVCFLIETTAFSQSEFIGFGFRAGLSFAKLDGPSETGPNGESLESYTMANGFHIGALINFKFTDLVGLRTEFVYSQRGTEYLYEGPSYFVLGKGEVLTTTISGTRKQTMNISNAYLDIPLLVYYKLGSLELNGGFNAGLLVSSTGGGTIDFDGTSGLGNTIPTFRVNLNHNYKKDKAGEVIAGTQQVIADGRSYTVPGFVGAYYDFASKDKSLFKTLDFGLVAGASYFINEGLFLGVRYLHGLGDMDRNEYDISLQSLNQNGTHIPRSDINKSKSLQFSIGFSF